MKTRLPWNLILVAIVWLAATLAAPGQGTNPLRINCPANLTNWICGVASTATVFYPPPTTTAGCPTNAIVTCSPPSGALFPVGTTTVTCRATNSCRESVVCTFTVTVARDTIPPVIQCPTNRIVWLCGTAATTAVVTWPPPVATDNADTSVSVSCSPPSGSFFPLGTTTVTCTATDNCTNRTACTFTVTVARDTQPPTIDCPGNLNVIACAATGAAVNFPKPTAVDNADSNVEVVCSPASGSVFPVGSTTVTCTATDDCTNRTTCTFTVRVIRDTTPPTITCPTNRVVLLCGTAATIPVNFPPPIVSDTIDPDPTVTCVPPSGSAFPPGTNTVVCTATDDCGNARSCSFTITVNRDITPPTIVCPTNINLVVTNCADPGAVVNYPMPFIVDALDPQTRVSCVPASGSFFPVGTTTVTCAAEDGCGNRDTCSFNVTVRPRPFFDGLCHTPLGLAALNTNSAGELEVTGVGGTGQDGVRIDLGESDGLRWWMRHPVLPVGQPEGTLEVEVRGKTQSGPEVSLSRMTYGYRNGRVSVTPGAASYEFKLLLNGEVVYRQSGRSGAFNLPDCIPVWNPHCWGEEPSEFPDNPLLPHCMWLLDLSCDVETDGGPVHADTLVVTPEGPLPPFASVSAIQFVGRNIPGFALRSESLLMFGGNGQPSRPHRALGQARMVAESGVLRVENLAPGNGSGAAVEFFGLGNPPAPDDPGGGYIDEDFPPTAPEPGAEIRVTSRRADGGNCAESMIDRLSLNYLDLVTARLTLACSVCELWDLYRYQVYRGGELVGGGIQSGTGPIATLTPATTGLSLPTPSRIARYPLHLHQMGIQMRFEHLATFTLQNGTTVIGDEIRIIVSTTSGSPIPFAGLEQAVSGFPSFTITGGGVLRPLELACPPDMTVQTCSTNPVPVRFPSPAVNGGACSTAPFIACVPPSGSLFPPGVTVVQCTATNACGEQATCSFRVTVVRDTTPPVIQCPTNIIVGTCSNFALVRFDVTATDDSDPNPTVVCVPPSGSLFPLGTTTVTCTATDRCTNTSVCTFTVRVKSDATPELENEPNDALASAHDLGHLQFAVVVGRIGVAGDTDYYRFTAPPNARAWITVDTGGQQWAGANSRNSAVTLLNAGGAVLELDDNDGSGNGANGTLESGDASAIAGALLPGGTFFVRVSAAVAGDLIAPYRLYLNITTNNAGVEIEPNNNFVQANIVAGGAVPIGARLGALAVNEEDWFSFSIPGPSIVHLSLDGDPERDGVGTDVVLELYRQDGVSLLFSANSSAAGAAVAEGFPYRLSISGTYYVRVRGVSAGVTGTYRLLIATCPGRPELPLAGGILGANGLRLSWPAASESFALLTTSDLRKWREAPVTPVFDGDRLIADIPTGPPHQFFQLAPAGGWSNDTYHCCDANGQNCSEPVNPLTACDNLIWCHETEDSTVCEQQ